MSSDNTIWQLDIKHSSLEFEIRHLYITHVKGIFRKFNAVVLSNGTNFNQAKVTARVNIASIFTNDEERDNHIRSADFFDADQYPESAFNSTSVSGTEGKYQVTGVLTLKGITKEIVLDVIYHGRNKDLDQRWISGFSISTCISRKDFGLEWNTTLMAGGGLIGDKVEISGELEFIETTEVSVPPSWNE